jgi:hypothetical protein
MNLMKANLSIMNPAYNSILHCNPITFAETEGVFPELGIGILKKKRLLLKVWIIPEKVWIILHNVWIILHKVWIIPEKVWMIPEKVWIILHNVWMIPDKVWIFPLKVWMILEKEWITLMKKQKCIQDSEMPIVTFSGLKEVIIDKLKTPISLYSNRSFQLNEISIYKRFKT